MKSLLRPDRAALLLALAFASPLGAALTPTEWAHRQSVHVAAPGLVRVELTAASFDAAAPHQEDLRIIDANGREIASLLDHPPSPIARPSRPASFELKLTSDATMITLATGTKDPLAAVTLETPQPYFLRGAQIAISDDGSTWTTLDQGLPLFRQWGVEKLSLPLGNHSAAYVRIVVTENHANAVVFTGASLSLSAAEAPALVPVGAQISSRDEFAGETVLTLTLDGRHLPLAALEFDTPEPLFMRRLTVTVREARDALSVERPVGAGTLYRVALDGAPARAQLDLPLNFAPATRELLVHIHNGDSPPLELNGIRLKRWPVSVLFIASAPGTYTLLSGNPQASAPHYDLAGFAGEMRGAHAASIVPGDLEATPNYQPRDSLADASLPDVPLTGAPLDISDWHQRRTLVIERPGVQELELDVGALYLARSDFADLRVMREGNQIPYVLELPALARSIALPALSMPDSTRPSVSVWQLRLPQSALPLRRIVLTTKTPLFQRDFRIFEKISTTDGQVYEHVLATGRWSRTPEPGVPETRAFDFTDRMQTETLWIETNNGDNPALTLGTAQVIYPVVRLIFKTAETTGFTLLNDNPSAMAPRYDLSLVAEKLLTSNRNVAKLFLGTDAGARLPIKTQSSGYIFWGALGLVVIVLLVVVAKLLPKPPAA